MERPISNVHTEPAMDAQIPFIPFRTEMEQYASPEAYVTPRQSGEACGYCVTPAMAYIPDQKWVQLYEAEVGFKRGTIFPQLDLPFLGEGARQR